MATLREWTSRLWGMVRSTRDDRELEQELRVHVELAAEDARRRGHAPESALRAARIQVGGLAQAMEALRDQRGLPWLEDLITDGRHAIRGLARRPGFAIAAILTLAIGIGANTAIFSLINGILLHPLPYKDPEDLVRVFQNRLDNQGTLIRDPGTNTARYFGAIRQQTQTLAQVAAYESIPLTLSGSADSVRLVGVRVSPVIFPMLGARARLGRLFDESEANAGANAVVILSDAAWHTYFGGDPGIVGRTITLDTNTYSVVGILAPEFVLPRDAPSPRTAFRTDQDAEVWIPLTPALAGPPTVWGVNDNNSTNHQIIGRLKDGVTLEQAAVDTGAILQQIDHPRVPPGKARVELARLKDELVEPVRPALRVLMVAVALVLLIACSNVASLLLGRLTSIQREIAVRAALGAGNGRLIRQAITESLILSVTGGAAGVVLARFAIELLKNLGSKNIPRLNEISIDLSVLAVAFAVSVVTGVLCGLAPALRVSRADYLTIIRESSSNAGRFSLLGQHRSRGVLVAAELALAMVLLVGAGLLLRSFHNLINVDTGYDAADVLTFQVPVPSNRYPNPLSFDLEVVRRLESLPNVRFAGATPSIDQPIAGNGNRFVIITSLPGRPRVAERFVTPDYLRAMGVQVLSGRGLQESDGSRPPWPLVVNQTFVKRFFPQQNALGQPIIGEGTWEIVGVVEDVLHAGFDARPEPQVYMDLRRKGQTPDLSRLYFAVQMSNVNAPGIVPAIRQTLRQLDPELALGDVATMAERLARSDSVARSRFYAVLLSIFSGAALLLAAIGTFGVMSYAVAQRTREIGIRMALGAQRSQVLRLVLQQGLTVTTVGLAAGLLGAKMMTRYLQGMLFGLTPTDPLTFVAGSSVFALVAMLACYIPARRATKVDPLLALRYE